MNRAVCFVNMEKAGYSESVSEKNNKRVVYNEEKLLEINVSYAKSPLFLFHHGDRMKIHRIIIEERIRRTRKWETNINI